MVENAKDLVVEFILEMKASEVKKEEIVESMELHDQLNIDSLKKLILITRLTEHMEIDFSQTEKTVNDFVRVADLISFVEEHKSK